MQDSLDPLTVSLVEGLAHVVRNALATPVHSERTPEGVPELVHLALRVVALRQELALTEARLETALRAPVTRMKATASQPRQGISKSPSGAQPGPRQNRKTSSIRANKAKDSAGSTTLTERVTSEAKRRTTPFKTDAIVAAVGGQSTTVRTLLERLVAKGILRKAERGTYAPAATPTKKPGGKGSASAPKAKPTRAPEARGKGRKSKAKASPSKAPRGTAMSDRAVALLTERAAPVGTSELASALQVEVPSLAAAMSKLVQAGSVQRVSPGVFAVSSKRRDATVEGSSHA
jgi:predicted transcriptional regulator